MLTEEVVFPSVTLSSTMSAWLGLASRTTDSTYVPSTWEVRGFWSTRLEMAEAVVPLAFSLAEGWGAFAACRGVDGRSVE